MKTNTVPLNDILLILFIGYDKAQDLAEEVNEATGWVKLPYYRAN